MRQGSILEGIISGFQSYMNTRQWQGQMEQGKLDRERAALANRMLNEQYQDYQDPMRQAKREAPARDFESERAMRAKEKYAPRELALDVAADEEKYKIAKQRKAGETEEAYAMRQRIIAEAEKRANQMNIQNPGYYHWVDSEGQIHTDERTVQRNETPTTAMSYKDAYKTAIEAMASVGIDNPVANPDFPRLVSVYTEEGGIERANAMIRMMALAGGKDTEKMFEWTKDIPTEYADQMEQTAEEMLLNGATKNDVLNQYKEWHKQLIEQGVAPRPTNIIKTLDKSLDILIPPPPMIYKGQRKPSAFNKEIVNKKIYKENYGETETQLSNVRIGSIIGGFTGKKFKVMSVENKGGQTIYKAKDEYGTTFEFSPTTLRTQFGIK